MINFNHFPPEDKDDLTERLPPIPPPLTDDTPTDAPLMSDLTDWIINQFGGYFSEIRLAMRYKASSIEAVAQVIGDMIVYLENAADRERWLVEYARNKVPLLQEALNNVQMVIDIAEEMERVPDDEPSLEVPGGPFVAQTAMSDGKEGVCEAQTVNAQSQDQHAGDHKNRSGDIAMLDAKESTRIPIARLMTDPSLCQEAQPVNENYEANMRSHTTDQTPYSKATRARLGPTHGHFSTTRILDWTESAGDLEKAGFTLAMEFIRRCDVSESVKDFAKHCLDKLHGEGWLGAEPRYDAGRRTFCPVKSVLLFRQKQLSVAHFLTIGDVLAGEEGIRINARCTRLLQIWHPLSFVDLTGDEQWPRRAITDTARGQDLLDQLAPSTQLKGTRKIFVEYINNDYPSPVKGRKMFTNYEEAWLAFVIDCQAGVPLTHYWPSDSRSVAEIEKKLTEDYFWNTLVPIIREEWSRSADVNALWNVVKAFAESREKKRRKSISESSFSEDDEAYEDYKF